MSVYQWMYVRLTALVLLSLFVTTASARQMHHDHSTIGNIITNTEIFPSGYHYSTNGHQTLGAGHHGQSWSSSHSVPCDCQGASPNCSTCLDRSAAGNSNRSQHVVGVQTLQTPGPGRPILGVNEFVARNSKKEPTFKDSQLVPWESFSFGEYVGPHRTPHVPEYRFRVDDQLEFVFYLSRQQSATPYRIFVGDTIRVRSATERGLEQEDPLRVLSDGTVTIPLIGRVHAAGKTIEDLQDDLNRRYSEFFRNPSFLVQVVDSDTPLRDVLESVDARGGVGGRLRQATVSPDGTVQLPVIGSVPAVGLTTEEIRHEINLRYSERVKGLEVTPVLLSRAPRFLYVLGQVETPGRFELTGPTTVMQAIALAGGDLQGANLRNVIVFRRDEAWRLTATRLDLAGAIHGRRPYPSDEIFLRDSDIVLLPRKPIQRLSEAVDLYLTQTLYAALPQELIFNDTFEGLFAGGDAAAADAGGAGAGVVGAGAGGG